jgi:DNA-binding transcriptional regulator YiaG
MARGCTKMVRVMDFLCDDHWGLVPARIRRVIWATYEAGQLTREEPSEVWRIAADALIGVVSARLGAPLTERQEQGLFVFYYSVVEGRLYDRILHRVYWLSDEDREENRRRWSATRLQNLRHGLGLTISEMAIRFGVAYQTVCNWESGRAFPRHPARAKLEAVEKELEEGRNLGLELIRKALAQAN